MPELQVQQTLQLKQNHLCSIKVQITVRITIAIIVIHK